MIRPWPLIASEPMFDAGLLQVIRDRARSPRTGGERDFHVIRMIDWLMAVPLTEDKKLVMVRQYRHGSREASLEVPGGLHDGNAEEESPEQGAARELAEETGYSGGAWAFLGQLRPQPALFSNRAWIYLARDVRLTSAPKLDAGEDIEVVLLGAQEVPARIASGEINNAMTVAALALAHYGGYL
ncbi:MAG: NUDIX hydrolase [Proteobacteria bacterium]|nr:NUDIX hydrolase [Pseudomonadota bacterium]MBU4581210.1 NUDIX hydrolase [Pseudomonadota bacterium]MCG2739531.1 NUDIX hydrolase [Syntrophaceae bacterium]